MKTKFSLRQIIFIGLFAALVFVFSRISIDIATPIDSTRIHFGNIMCLLSGLLLGPLSGGLAAGIGSMFFDLFDPKYISSAPFTFVFKFAMAFLCGLIAWRKGRNSASLKFNLIACIIGAATYLVLYLGKTAVFDLFIQQVEWQAMLGDVGTKALTSGANALIAVIGAVAIDKLLNPQIKKMARGK